MVQTKKKDNIYIEVKSIFDLIDDFINSNINDVNNYANAIIEFNKIVLYMKDKNYKITTPLANLLLSNSKIYNIIEQIVNKHIYSIRDYSYRSLFNGYDLLLIDLYCVKNNIEVNEQDLSISNEDLKYDSLKIYLDSFDLPILTAEQQIELGRIMVNGRQKNATLKQKQEAKKAKDTLITHNMRLVFSIAKKKLRYTSNIGICDLTQEGYFGLETAANKYDPEKGVKFSSYATWWIRQKIDMYICDYLELPRHLSTYYLQYSKVLYELTAEYGCEPSAEDIADKLDTTATKIERLKDLSANKVSLNSVVDDGNGTELINFVESQDPTPDISAEQKDLEKYLIGILRQVDLKDPRYSFIIVHRYGLFGNSKKTLVDITELLKKHKFEGNVQNNISHQRVTQLEKKAFKYMAELVHNDYNKYKYYNGDSEFSTNNSDNYFFYDNKTIYSYFEKYSEDIVLAAIELLDSHDYKLVKERFGDNFDKPEMGQYWNYKKEDYFTNYILPRIKNNIIICKAKSKKLLRGIK